MSTTIYNMVSIVDQWLFKNIATIQGYSATDVSEWWGIFSGKYRVLTNVPISISIGTGSVLCSGTGSSFLHRKMRNRFALKSVCPCALSWWLPCRVLQVSWYWQIRSSSFCFRGSSPLAGHLLQAGGISVNFLFHFYLVQCGITGN